MNCEMSKDYIMKYFDKDINDIESAQLKQHLQVCRRCSEEFNSMSKIFGLLEKEGMIEPPQGFEMKVMEKISAQGISYKKRSEREMAFLYTMITLVLVVFPVLFVVGIMNISFPDFVDWGRNTFSSVSDSLVTVFDVITDMIILFKSLVNAMLQVAFVIIKAYFYIFAALAMMLYMGEKKFVNLVKQGGGTR